MTTLKQAVLKHAAFDEREWVEAADSDDIEYREFMRGKYQQSKTLEPLIELLADVAHAADAWMSYTGDTRTINESLDRLRDLLGGE